jgi:serine/threonine protein kinase
MSPLYKSLAFYAILLNFNVSKRWQLAGGAGSVYLGLLYDTTAVAIKVVSSPDPAQQKNFVKEIMILKACRHPNIISFLGASLQAQQTLLVMEFMPGGDLYTQIQNDINGRYTWYQR